MTDTVEVEVAPETKKWLEGKKTYTGIAIIAIPLIAMIFGYDVRDGFPIEFARFGTELVTTIGVVLAFYGRWKTKPKELFVKK